MEDERDPVGLRHRMRRAERRISSQHRQLDEFFAQVLGALDRGAVHSAASAFQHFGDALEAHLSLEEELYFPALRSLRPVTAAEIEVLCVEHGVLRADLVRISALLRSAEIEVSRESVEALGDRLMTHEAVEERLVGRIK